MVEKIEKKTDIFHVYTFVYNFDLDESISVSYIWSCLNIKHILVFAWTTEVNQRAKRVSMNYVMQQVFSTLHKMWYQMESWYKRCQKRLVHWS